MVTNIALALFAVGTRISVGFGSGATAASGSQNGLRLGPAGTLERSQAFGQTIIQNVGDAIVAAAVATNGTTGHAFSGEDVLERYNDPGSNWHHRDNRGEYPSSIHVVLLVRVAVNLVGQPAAAQSHNDGRRPDRRALAHTQRDQAPPIQGTASLGDGRVLGSRRGDGGLVEPG